MCVKPIYIGLKSYHLQNASPYISVIFQRYSILNSWVYSFHTLQEMFKHNRIVHAYYTHKHIDEKQQWNIENDINNSKISYLGF